MMCLVVSEHLSHEHPGEEVELHALAHPVLRDHRHVLLHAPRCRRLSLTVRRTLEVSVHGGPGGFQLVAESAVEQVRADLSNEFRIL